MSRRIRLACLAVTADPERMDAKFDQMAETAQWLQDNLRWQAPDWDVEVYPFAELVDDVGDYGLSAWGDLKDRVHSAKPDIEFTHWGIFGVNAGDAGGIAWPNTNEMAVTSVGAKRLALHEIRHMLGGHHHVTGELGTRPENYGGPSDAGHGYAPTGTYAHLVGLLPAERVATGPGWYFLATPSSSALADGEYKAVYFELDDRLWAAGFFEGRVWIDTYRGPVHQDPPWAGAHAIESLRPGQSWRNVAFLRIVQGVAEVSIGRTEPVDPPELTASGELVEDKAGIWQFTDGTHQGLDIHLVGNRLVGCMYTYGESGPTWMQIDGEVHGDHARFVLNAVDSNTREKDVREIGGGVLSFSSDLTGEMIYHVTCGDRYLDGRHAVPLERVTRREGHAFQGFYEFEDHESEGLSLGVPSPGRIVGYWYGYAFGSALPMPTWRVLDGEPGGIVIIYEPEGGLPHTHTASKLVRWGEGTIRQKSFRYQRDGWPKPKTVHLGRLV